MKWTGLIVGDPWLDLILEGSKTWEMRRRATAKRGLIALIRKGTGTVVGVAKLDDVLCPLSRRSYNLHARRHCVPPSEQSQVFRLGWRVPWVLSDAYKLKRPVKYQHPKGAVVWVRLNARVCARVLEQLPARVARQSRQES